MLDFASALYLGFRHPHGTLCPWAQLTTGRPAALESPPGAEAVGRGLARLIGCERATLATSTLHIYWDLFDMLATDGIAIHLGQGTYPIACWGVERVAGKGVPVAAFRQHDAGVLRQQLERSRRLGLRPVVVTDGLCPASGQPAPLADYLKLVRAHKGYLVIDDTQALGILGSSQSRESPYGRGGRGTPAWHGIEAPELIVGSSLAKGFGVPVAVLAGARNIIERFEAQSATRVHCSAPSAPLVAATEHALALNRSHGEQLRQRLLDNVRRFRARLREFGLSADGACFPVQTPRLGTAAEAIHDRLLGCGVRTVLHRARQGLAAKISFLIAARHEPMEIERGVELLARAANGATHLTFTRANSHEQTIELHA